MSPWDVIQQALSRMKPAKDQEWLAEILGISAQAVSNWKARGVPSRQYRSIAGALGLTVDQLEGLAPLPWAASFEWPFSARLYGRLEALSQDEINALEERIWDILSQRQIRKREFTVHTSDTPINEPNGVATPKSHKVKTQK